MNKENKVKIRWFTKFQFEQDFEWSWICSYQSQPGPPNSPLSPASGIWPLVGSLACEDFGPQPATPRSYDLCGSGSPPEPTSSAFAAATRQNCGECYWTYWSAAKSHVLHQGNWDPATCSTSGPPRLARRTKVCQELQGPSETSTASHSRHCQSHCRYDSSVSWRLVPGPGIWSIRSWGVHVVTKLTRSQGHLCSCAHVFYLFVLSESKSNSIQFYYDSMNSIRFNSMIPERNMAPHLRLSCNSLRLLRFRRHQNMNAPRPQSE